MKKFISWFAMILGFLGIALCVACLVGVWIYYPQLTEKTRNVYSKIDEALVLAGDRIDRMQEKAADVNAMTSDFRSNLKDWGVKKGFDQLEVVRRAEQIATRLHQVVDSLAFAKSFLQKIRDAQRLAHPFSKGTETPKLDGLLEQIGKLEVQLSGIFDSIDRVRQQAEESAGEAALEGVIERALGEIVPAVKILDSTEERLENFSIRVTEIRSQSEAVEVHVLVGLWWGRLGASIVLLWMALGQFALCVCSWRRG